MLFNKGDKSYDAFWLEYEEKTGEKILARGLGKYISGWDEFDEKKWGGIWGLIITTSGGFRFHHFPQNSWIDSFTSFIKTQPQKEKTIFIPNDKIISCETIKETKWWKKLLCSSPPLIVIKYMDDVSPETGKIEKKIILEAEYNVQQ
jgi:hypothetical protein